MTSPTKAWTALRTAMIDTEPACKGDSRFTAEDSVLSDLAPICRACPLLAPCRNLAQTSRAIPVWGILGASDRRGNRSTQLMNSQAMGRLVNG